MARVYEVAGAIIWDCPGCGVAHKAAIGPEGWTWNGDVDAPTLRPSFVVEYQGAEKKVCHCYITDGKARFLPNSYHELAGQTVDLPEWGS